MIGCALIFMACDDIIEEDISDEMITIIAPKEDAVIIGNSIQFRWNTIEGAEEYRIQITTQEEQVLLLDSLVVLPVFDFTLNSGDYQWRVRGENFGYQSPFSMPSNFSTQVSENLTDLNVELLKPDDNVVVNAPDGVRFSWSKIEPATKYVFELLGEENGLETIEFTLDDLTQTEAQLPAGTITDDGVYKWRVMAVNESNDTETVFFSRTISIDTAIPDAPTLTAPVEDFTTTVDTEVQFTWEFADQGTVQSDITATIQIASDEVFTTNLVEEEVEGTNMFDYTPTTAGDKFWRVKGTDAAGNEGAFTTARKLIVN